MSSILVVHRDASIAQLISQFLSSRGHQVVTTTSGERGIRCLLQVLIDLLITEYGGPAEKNPPGIGCWLRSHPLLRSIPMLVITQPGEEPGKRLYNCFDPERDGFLVKPFSLEALDREVEKLLGLKAEATANAPHAELSVGPFRELRVGPLRLDPHTFTVFAGGEAILLTPMEFRLLEHLLEHTGEVVSSERLLQEVWRCPPGTGSPELVRVHMRNLRLKIDRSAHRHLDLIETVSRHGYTIGGAPTATVA